MKTNHIRKVGPHSGRVILHIAADLPFLRKLDDVYIRTIIIQELRKLNKDAAMFAWYGKVHTK
jgi:hypothetical protein